jgi:phosphatidylglycerophosphate synthase
MPDIKSHKRINDIFLASLERPALNWLAAHTPSWLGPDHMTVLGLFGSLVIFTGYWLTNLNPAFLWLASLGFVINWYGDSLDGTLARFRRQERPVYGFFVDHTVDAISEVLVFLGLGLSPFVRFDLACLALIGYLLLSVLVYIRTCVKGEFVISYGKLGPTEARLIAVTANTLIFFIGNPQMTVFNLDLSVYDGLVALIVVLLFGIFLSSTVSQAIILAKEGK